MLANPCCKKSSLFFLLILFCVGERWQQEKSIWHGYSAWSYIIIIIILLNNFPPGINKVLWFWFWLCFCKCAKIIQLKKKIYIYISFNHIKPLFEWRLTTIIYRWSLDTGGVWWWTQKLKMWCRWELILVYSTCHCEELEENGVEEGRTIVWNDSWQQEGGELIQSLTPVTWFGW